jgi:hypothetical protein
LQRTIAEGAIRNHRFSQAPLHCPEIEIAIGFKYPSPMRLAVVSARSCTVANRNRIRLPSFDPRTSVIVADLAAVFAEADPKTRASCAQVYRNVGLDLSTGKPLETQRVYRVE